MNAHADHAGNAGHGHGHDHHDDDDGAAHGTLNSYVTGFILAAILTAIPFWLVMDLSLIHICGRSGGARLEVAVPLSRTGRGGGQ